MNAGCKAFHAQVSLHYAPNGTRNPMGFRTGQKLSRFAHISFLPQKEVRCSALYSQAFVAANAQPRQATDALIYVILWLSDWGVRKDVILPSLQRASKICRTPGTRKTYSTKYTLMRGTSQTKRKDAAPIARGAIQMPGCLAQACIPLDLSLDRARKTTCLASGR